MAPSCRSYDTKTTDNIVKLRKIAASKRDEMYSKPDQYIAVLTSHQGFASLLFVYSFFYNLLLPEQHIDLTK